MANSIRDKIRSKALSGAEFKKEIVKIEGEEVELREPSAKVRNEVFKHSKEDGEINPMLFIVWTVIYCSYVPNTKERVFEDTDFDTLMNLPAHKLDSLSEAAGRVLNTDEEERKK